MPISPDGKKQQGDALPAGVVGDTADALSGLFGEVQNTAVEAGGEGGDGAEGRASEGPGGLVAPGAGARDGHVRILQKESCNGPSDRDTAPERSQRGAPLRRVRENQGVESEGPAL